ncbi:MAG: nucleotidyltransferase family protein [Candidatus Caenarcaniphilales bacterium]|nr:nucleotidyltransferase family protein [Candidatus Caenarcaniphilales bacterium]
MNIYELINNKRAEILDIASKHGAYNIRIFGSVSRGEASETSDIDLLVDYGDNISPWFPGGLIKDLEELLGLTVDVATINGLKERIRNRVINESIPL